MRMLKNVKRMIATVLSVTTCLTPGLGVSANGGNNKAITIQTGPLDKNQLPNQLPLVYNDDYFDGSAFDYNESLATASLALELSGFADTSDYADQAKNAKKALGELGFGDIQENDGYQEKTATDSIGVVAANKKIKSNNEEYTLIPVVIRGGGYEKEWGGNAKVGKSGDHEGFDTAATKAKEFVDNYIKEKKIKGKVKLWIVGYSRGGATAGLLGVKFNRDFISTLNELNKDSKDPSDEEYYNSYVEKERARTSKKYESEIEMNPNDLYVYTFEAPMGMNIADGSGLYEYKGDIPYSGSKKSDQAIYENIHNTINDDDFVTKVAPRIWGFARPGVDHKLLEGRRANDVKNTEEVLNSFLVNQAYPGSIKYVGNTLVKKSKSWKQMIFGPTETLIDFWTGFARIEDFSGLGDGIIGVLDRALNRARKWENDQKYKNMNTREYYADRYQATISKLAVAIMGDFDKAISEGSRIVKRNDKDLESIKLALAVNTNDFDKPFNKLIDEFSKKMNVNFDAQERKNLINLIKGADQYAESALLLYFISYDPAVFEMHAPEVHLATLISKDKKNKDLYDAQIKKINADNADQIQNAKEKENILKEFVDIGKDEKKDSSEFVDIGKDEKKDSSEFVDIEKVAEEDSSEFVDIEKVAEKVAEEDSSGFVDVKKDMYDQGITEYGWNRACAFKKEMDDFKEAHRKNIFKKTSDKLGKGLKGAARGLGVGSAVSLAIQGGKKGVDLTKKGTEKVVKGLYDGVKYGFQWIRFGSKKNK